MDQKQLNERFVEFQKATMFPDLPEGFYFHAQTALSLTSPVATKITIASFKELCNKEEYNLYDLGYILHCMEIRTAKEMEMSLEDYCDYMEMVDDVVKKWRAIVAPKQESLQKEFEALQKIEQENSGRTIEMKPIAQA